MRPQRMRPPKGGPGKLASNSAINDTPADRLLPRLDRVRQTGSGQWIARCPSHDDRSPSLSIREVDGRLLIHCFAGCEPGDVLAAVGLELKDMFDRPLTHNRKPLTQRQRYGQAEAALQALSHEALIVMIAADRLAAGVALGEKDRHRLHMARDAIQAAHATAGRQLPEPPPAFPELKRPSEFLAEIVEDFRGFDDGQS